MTNEREHIQQAIVALESHRHTLGDSVVDTTIAALRHRLDRTQEINGEASHDRSAQRKQVTILFANVSGLATLAETIPNNQLLEIINTLWNKLDGAIMLHGGVIDKHMGDGVMGLFGVPTASENDPERAVRAALAMRAALSDFLSDVQAMQRSGEWPSFTTAAGEDPLQRLWLSVGINTGPVLLGEVGTLDEYTVIGDAVNVASRLERAASAGGILISHDTYLLVRGVFDVESLGPVPLKGRSEPVPVYLVLGVKPRLLYSSGRGVEGVETQMVGRDKEITALQEVYVTAVSQKTGRTVAIIGDAGVGKSRLLHEYVNWLRAQDEALSIFKGRTYESSQQIPYALFRDMFSTHFNIQDNDPPAVVEDKLLRGMLPHIVGNAEDARKRVSVIAHLFGMDFADGITAVTISQETTQIRDRAYGYVTDYFEQMTIENGTTLLVFEDIHWADSGSLELIDHLATLCAAQPLIIVMLTRPSLFDRRPSMLATAVDDPHPPLRLELTSLDNAASNALVQQILRKLTDIPPDLSDLIVTRSEGNPFYLEELIKVLIEDGVIITGQEQWRIHRNQLKDLRVPPNITGVIQARLDRLSGLERQTLQRAAVVGRLFWNTAIVHMNDMAPEPISPADTMSALQALEKREMIFPRQASMLAGSQTYVFKHAILQQVTYESVLLRVRPRYHKQIADWLVEQSGERAGEYAGIIAQHYELSGEKLPAAELYEIAGTRAQDTYKPEIATDYYRRALSLIAEFNHHATHQLRLQEQLGHLLRMQARFVESAQTYMTMRYTAMKEGDLVAQAQAWIGLAGIQLEQADYAGMLESAAQAEQVAWLVNAEVPLSRAFLYKSEAYLRLGEMNLALTAALQALALNERLAVPNEIVRSLTILIRIYTELRQVNQANQTMNQLDEQMSRLEAQLSNNQTNELKRVAALSKSALGNLHNRLGQYEPAAQHLLSALRLYREIDLQMAIGNTLNTLGETVRLRGDARRALPLYREALDIAQVTGDVYGSLFYRTNLGAALADLQQYETAVGELQQVIALSQDVGRLANWHGLVETYVHLARAHFGLGQLYEAMNLAQKAYEQAQRQRDNKMLAIAWRLIGQVLGKRPSDNNTITLNEKQYEAADCFAESLRLLKDLEGSTAHREQALTLWAWSTHELAQGNAALSTSMRRDAQALIAEKNISLPADSTPIG